MCGEDYSLVPQHLHKVDSKAQEAEKDLRRKVVRNIDIAKAEIARLKLNTK